MAVATASSGSPPKPMFEMATIVSFGVGSVNVHSTVDLSGHSIRILRFGSNAFTSRSDSAPLTMNSQCALPPAAKGPLDRFSQNLVNILGSTKAANTSLAGRRISISTLAIGARLRLDIFLSQRNFVVFTQHMRSRPVSDNCYFPSP